MKEHCDVRVIFGSQRHCAAAVNGSGLYLVVEGEPAAVGRAIAECLNENNLELGTVKIKVSEGVDRREATRALIDYNSPALRRRRAG